VFFFLRNDLFSFFSCVSEEKQTKTKQNKQTKKLEKRECESHLVVGTKGLDELLLVCADFHSLVHILSFLLLC